MSILKLIPSYLEIEGEITRDEYYNEVDEDKFMHGVSPESFKDFVNGLILSDDEASELMEYMIMYLLASPYTTEHDKGEAKRLAYWYTDDDDLEIPASKHFSNYRGKPNLKIVDKDDGEQ
ncbi:hypothetical protein [Marinobacter salarius]|uniref:hypothetical protein n=1 Tax=Marinobacter salarius TaxID=1420917 RepID=UPI003BA9D0D4